MHLKFLAGWLAVLSGALPSIVAAQGIAVVDGIAEAAVDTQHVLEFQVLDGNNAPSQQAGLSVLFRLASDPAPPASTRVCREPVSAADTSCLPFATTDENGRVHALLLVGHTEGSLEVIAEVPGGQSVSHPVKALVANLGVTSGNTQQADEGGALPAPLEAQLTDEDGAGIEGQCVTAEVTQGEGTLESDAACDMGAQRTAQQIGNQVESGKQVTALTDANGKVRFTLRAGSSGRDIVVKVSALGLGVRFLAIVGSVDTPDIPRDIEVVGNVVYIADRDSLRVIDVTEPTNPEPRDPIKFGGGVSRLALDDNRLYVPTSNPIQLYVLDITEPASPKQRGVVNFVGEVQEHRISGIAAENGYAFIVTADSIHESGTLQVVDVREMDNPQVVRTASRPIPFQSAGIAVLGNRAYVPGGDLLILDISDPTQPIEESKLEGNFVSEIVLNRQVAYVLERLDKQPYFTVLDLSSPAAPQRRGVLPVREVRQIDTSFPIAVSGRFVYLVAYTFGLLTIDINDPDMPRLVGRIDTPSTVLSVATTSQFIYATDFIFGLQVIRGPLFDHDTTGDGTPDAFLDTDGDGVIDFFDVFSDDPAEHRDTDRDGIGDNADPDDDNDGFSDVVEQQADPPTDPTDSRIFPLLFPPPGTTTIVVDASTATPARERNGTPATPYRSITEGLRVIKSLPNDIVSKDERITLQVRAGTYSPTTTQEIFPLEFAGTEPLTLQGAGRETTVIDAAFTSDVLSFGGATEVIIEDVTCLHGEGGVLGNFAESITLRRNRIAENVVSGIELGDNALRNVITENLIEGNLGVGIALFNNAEATITANTIKANSGDGVSVSRLSSATITGNEIRDNNFAGIAVNTESMAEISMNIIEDNGYDGVSVFNNSSATITSNEVRSNGLASIEDNGIDGVSVSRLSSATITSNEIRSNVGFGIYVFDNACVVIDGGTIADSGDSGVFLEDASSAAIGFGSEAAGGLVLTHNKGDGITIIDDDSFALINRARVIFENNGFKEIFGPYTEDPADPRVGRIHCFMP